ncbi:MAG: tyrosine-type recombinase/integrase [Colwellia sp.]
MLKETIDKYVSMKRAMGFKFKVPNSLLQSFAVFAEARGEMYVRCHTVIEWAGLATSTAQKRNRLLTVRRFSIAMKSGDNQYEIPPCDAFGRHASERRIPHIYTSDELQLLFNAASQLKPECTIKPKTYTTIFALLATTGLRISEALALNIDDISNDGLLIRCTKFTKDRLVPLHLSAKKAIEYYLSYRSKYNSEDPALFVSNKGTRLPYSTVCSTFLQLMREIGLRDAPGTSGICLHDLRHYVYFLTMSGNVKYIVVRLYIYSPYRGNTI